jgi:predicted Zn-dependent protease with MMP-like domain
LSEAGESPDRIAHLQRAMQLITDAIDDLPAECRGLAGNALLNIAAEASDCRTRGYSLFLSRRQP